MRVEGISLLGRSQRTCSTKVFLKISLNENVFPGLSLPYETKSECLGLSVKQIVKQH